MRFMFLTSIGLNTLCTTHVRQSWSRLAFRDLHVVTIVKKDLLFKTYRNALAYEYTPGIVFYLRVKELGFVTGKAPILAKTVGGDRACM